MTERRIERYVLGELLGSGGMGNVHVARMNGPLGVTKRVAVKELHPHLARDAEFVTMLLEEARLQAALEHPNVVPVLDVLARDGELLVVLGLVPGPSLAEVLRSLREGGMHVPEPVAVGLLLDVLEGLHAAHELRDAGGARLGVVHRDVSPHNILVGDGVARVTDFGVAKVLDRAQLTRGGRLKGKPGYMSPEQLQGGTVDARSDVYAAALVLAELLTGERVCPSHDVVEAQRFHATELADPAAWLAPRELSPNLSRWLGGCLATDPDARPSSAREAALTLARAVPRASSAEIAAWLDGVVPDLVAERRALLACGGGEQSAVTAPTGAPARDDEDLSRTEPPLRAAPSAASLRARAPWAIAALAVAGAFVCGRTSHVEHARARPGMLSAATPSAQAVATAPVTTAGAATSEAPVVPTTPPIEEAPPKKAPRGAVASTVRALPSPGRAVTSPSAAPSAPSAAPRSCSPPYDVDPSGVRTWKPECL